MIDNDIFRRTTISVNVFIWKGILNVTQKLNEMSLHVRRKCIKVIPTTCGLLT